MVASRRDFVNNSSSRHGHAFRCRTAFASGSRPEFACVGGIAGGRSLEPSGFKTVLVTGSSFRFITEGLRG